MNINPMGYKNQTQRSMCSGDSSRAGKIPRKTWRINPARRNDWISKKMNENKENKVGLYRIGPMNIDRVLSHGQVGLNGRAEKLNNPRKIIGIRFLWRKDMEKINPPDRRLAMLQAMHATG